ncbi:SpoIIE family protein phosphatase [Pararhizobium sp.]|uniref:SpoIIE family protein phosphatase n=1 Tax=Pararhizobium sp. TaxID=1977563 RepID=UPI003D133A88
MTAADIGDIGAAPGRFSLRSFRAKFILVVGAALLFDFLLSGGIAIFNVQRLSRDVAAQVGEGLTSANEEFLRTYIETTAQRADLLLEGVHSQLETLAGVTQFMLDNPATSERVGNALLADPALSSALQYNATAGWAQNGAGAPSAVSVWGYLLDEKGVPKPAAQAAIRDSAILELLGPALMATGSPKLQLYYIGPKDASITRSVPYSNQASTLDDIYPGHNKGPSFWDFFFPGIYEGWQSWLVNPSARPTDTDIVATMPYIDSTSGSMVVSYFDALYTPDRKAVAGGVAVDLTLDQLVNLVESVNIGETGFGFLTTSSGNVLATNALGERTLGLSVSDVGGQGVTGVARSLRGSSQTAISGLELPRGGDTVLRHIFLDEKGEQVPYLVVLKQLAPNNLWDGSKIVAETMTLGFVVSERDIYHSLISAQANISAATRGIVNYQLLMVLASLLVVLAAVYAISGRITAGLRQLAEAAHRLQAKDYTVRVNIPSRDEVGAVGVAFNRMAEEIRYHTANLENLVAERTRELEKANGAINALNARLESENTRLGSELDIARKIQMMVLPRPEELSTVPRLDIAGYMAPADEVGGDYYDVLQNGTNVKIGIGDVTGHGLESGVLMLMVQSVARALQEQGRADPREFLEVLNRAIYKNVERTRTEKHLSLAFLDYSDGHITLSGQHEEVLIVRANGDVERIDTMDLGFPIGLESEIGAFIDTRDIDIANGDIIVLHTDGVTEAEAPGGELFGFDRLCKSAHRHRHGRAEEIKAAIIGDLMAFIDTQKIHDDITLVVMKHK